MSWIEDFAGSLTVEQQAALTAAIFAVAIAVAVGLTALAVGLKWSLIAWGAGVVVVVAAALFLPVDTADLVAEPRPETTYEGALARFEAERAKTAAPLNPLCEPQILGHGRRTQKAVVLLHGVSSCPQAFVDFAPLLHAAGYNVLAARMPQNGYADRSTDALARLTAEDLQTFGDTSVDIAAGLGEEVVVLGISAGGTVAAWIGQNRDVDRVVLVAPFFGLANFGVRLNVALMRVMLFLPPISIWKDPVLRDRFEGMPHAYQRQSTRGTGEIMRLGLATYRQARERAPAAAQAAIVTNAADTAVDNEVTRFFARAWIDRGMEVIAYEFDAGHKLGHELIDPLEPGSDPALTYPLLIGMIEDPVAALAAARK